MPSNRILDELQVTAELCGGREFSPAAARAMVHELQGYPEDAVIVALARCRREIRSLTLADILSRIEDGRPGPEEAWAMIPHDEAETVVWTPEMREAHAVAAPMIADGDMVGARMAFKEAYTRLLSTVRAERVPAKWEVSVGHDTSRRDGVIKEALRRKRISLEHARELVPSLAGPEPVKLLPSPTVETETAEYRVKVDEFLQSIREKLGLPPLPKVDPDSVPGTTERARAALEQYRKSQDDTP